MTTLDEILDDLSGFTWIPGIGQVIDGLRTTRTAAATGQLTVDGTQTLLALLGNPHGPDLIEALAGLAQTITNPTTNKALTDLDPQAVKTVQLEGELHAHETADWAPREHTNQAAGLLNEAHTTGGRCQTVDDAKRKEMHDKLAKRNEDSRNRPQ